MDRLHAARTWPGGRESKGGGFVTETGSLSSELLWRAALIAALIDAPLLVLIARRVSSGLFRELMWHLAGAGLVVYALLWGTYGSLYFWETVYKAIFPGWARWLLPGGFGLLFGALALGSWRLSRLAARRQAVWFVLLGGLVSLAGHGIGISRGLLRVPLLAQASAISALAFGVFEFIFYWCIMLGAAIFSHYCWQRIKGTLTK